MTFSKNWLEVRKSFDNEARNKSIEDIAIRHVSKNKHILDIGTGTGNNFFYYHKKFAPAYWTLIDNNVKLLYECSKRIKNISHVLVKNQSILDLMCLDNIDLITANAIFDLFSEEQFANFSQKICRQKICLLATLNYESMSFFPQEPLDKLFIKLYEQHMERKQNFGHAMGSKCTKKIVAILEKVYNYHVHCGPSNWVIDQKNSHMIEHMLFFMEDAIAANVPDKTNFLRWLQRKKENSELQIHVNHTDIFAHHF